MSLRIHLEGTPVGDKVAKLTHLSVFSSNLYCFLPFFALFCFCLLPPFSLAVGIAQSI